jgi:hypothetical protein
MATRKTAKSSAEECCAKCESDIAGLRKEVAALKRELAKKSAGGADPRVNKLIEVLKGYHPAWKNFIEEAGL